MNTENAKETEEIWENGKWTNCKLTWVRRITLISSKLLFVLLKIATNCVAWWAFANNCQKIIGGNFLKKMWVEGRETDVSDLSEINRENITALAIRYIRKICFPLFSFWTRKIRNIRNFFAKLNKLRKSVSLRRSALADHGISFYSCFPRSKLLLSAKQLYLA